MLELYVEVFNTKTRRWRSTNPTLVKRDSSRLAVLAGEL
jgi:hypothetical protein